ncbi:hypothetical protein Pla52o_36280 [Novipirellula galeiformis]|uniref:Uncharacterized protein n=1 Tax=Novipirellula galeiformis TaxID=2528004 RepID=A0A5C6C9N4_9BACT|nr:hypothetical protein [Novipirellula galeiformis]TWU21443.1 hypothetical protein Pla52o_36280 [Novipirellula galeiformis]
MEKPQVVGGNWVLQSETDPTKRAAVRMPSVKRLVTDGQLAAQLCDWAQVLSLKHTALKMSLRAVRRLPFTFKQRV